MSEEIKKRGRGRPKKNQEPQLQVSQQDNEPKVDKVKTLSIDTTDSIKESENKLSTDIGSKDFNPKAPAPKEEITELSYSAKKWKDYLEYLKMDPVFFLEKYPNHKFKEFIEEVIKFNSMNDKNSTSE